MRLLTVLLCLAATGCAASSEGPSRFVSIPGAVGDFTIPVKSVVERRFAGVIRQRYDFSCGSAALASLLRFGYDFDVSEETTFRGMWSKGDRVQIRRVGFSLLDMKRWLGSRGVSADGYKVSLGKIEKTGIPGIALVAVKNYRHFVVVKGVRGDEVLLGDPSAGLVVMQKKTFEEAWNGVYFVLSDDQQRAKLHFNGTAQWIAYARAPVGGKFSDPVSLQALSLTAPFYGDIS